MRSSLVALFLFGCPGGSFAIDGGTGAPVDGGPVDGGGSSDGGIHDGGTLDGGSSDGGSLDGGALDAGPADAGPVNDGGPPADGGRADSGPVLPDDGGRDPTLQPFTETSVWNLPIGSGAVWGNATDPDVAQLRGGTSILNAAGFGKPFYLGTAADPVVPMTATNQQYPIPVQLIHIPSPVPYDLWMDMFDETHPRDFWSYYSCNPNAANIDAGITCTFGALADVCSDGVTNIYGAGRYDWGIGTIRHWELDAGAIQHSLRYAATLSLAKSWPVWDQGIPWPNDNEDYDGPTAYSGDLYFGSTIGIPSDVDVTTLGLNSGGLLLAHALQDHGAIMRDTTGATDAPPGISFYAEPQDDKNPVIEEMRADLSTLTPYLNVLRNQAPTSVNGGGTPRAPLVEPLPRSLCGDGGE